MSKYFILYGRDCLVDLKMGWNLFQSGILTATYAPSFMKYIFTGYMYDNWKISHLKFLMFQILL